MTLQFLNRRATHAGQLERWLGVAATEQLSLSMKNWYGPPIAVAGVPGNVWAMKGGDFRGPILSGRFSNAFDIAESRIKSAWQRREEIFHAWARLQQVQCNAGFSSLGDLISEAAKGKKLEYTFQKIESSNDGTGIVVKSLWAVSASPPTGSTPSAAPGGDAPTSATAGAFPFTNPASGDTQHFVSALVASAGTGSTGVNTLLLYDRLFHVAKLMNSTATEAVTGVPTRYQSVTGTDPDYIGGNFLFAEVGAPGLANTAHNWTVCTYTDQAAAASTLPSFTGNAAAMANRLDHPTNQWFAPLESGDVGIGALTQMQCSALLASGVLNFVIGHPVAWMPCVLAGLICHVDGVFTSLNLARIFDDACLAFLVQRTVAGTPIFTGKFTAVAG